jgi:uncharacterized protein YtpQ (UPF0354 family)
MFYIKDNFLQKEFDKVTAELAALIMSIGHTNPKQIESIMEYVNNSVKEMIFSIKENDPKFLMFARVTSFGGMIKKSYKKIVKERKRNSTK